MNTRPRTFLPGPLLARLLRWAGAAALAACAAIAGCGGGVGVGGTGAYASGPITGFGSIIVNGVEFDDSTARVESEDSGGSRSDLRLGMVVEVESGPIGGSAAAPTASATLIRYRSEVLGPVSAVDPAAGTLVVLGQTVVVSTTTVFDSALANGLASVQVGAVVEVYGFHDAGASLRATRIEPRAAVAFRLRGPVQELDTVARTLRIGALPLGYAANVVPPPGLANGDVVRVTVNAAPLNGRWQVSAFGEGQRRLPDLDDVRLRGPVTSFASTRQFSVNGQPVDASGAAFPNGEAGVVLGARVEVEGPVVAGVLRARQVRIDDEGGPQGDFRLIGKVEAHQPAQRSFVLRNLTVLYDDTVEYSDGSAADIADGVMLEVRGVLSGDGTRVLATRIRFRR